LIDGFMVFLRLCGQILVQSFKMAKTASSTYIPIHHSILFYQSTICLLVIQLKAPLNKAAIAQTISIRVRFQVITAVFMMLNRVSNRY
jgi:hypothetical protein